MSIFRVSLVQSRRGIGLMAPLTVLMVWGAADSPAALPSQVSPPPPASQLSAGSPRNGKGAPMTPEQVVDRVLRKDWTVVEQPGNIGPNAAGPLQALLREADTEVRELAVSALGQAGGADGRRGLITALDDRSEMVRAAACRQLQRNHDAADLPALTKALRDNPDEYVREQAGLIIGRIGSTNGVAPLLSQLQTEADPHARQALSLALARLNEPANRSAYLQRLRHPEAKERALAVRDLPYVNDRKLLPQVLPLLEDLRPALNVGPSHGPYLIRVCDVTVNVLDEFLDHPFQFKIQPARHYTEQELASAKTILAGFK